MADQPKTTDRPTQDKPPETAKKHDGPKATEPDKKTDAKGAAGEGSAAHDD